MPADLTELRDRISRALARVIYRRDDPTWPLLEVCQPYADVVMVEVVGPELERLRKERDAARTEVAEEQRRADDSRTELLEERDQALHDLAKADAELERLRARIVELTALLNDHDRLMEHALALREFDAMAARDAEVDRLADGGDL